MPIIPEKFIVLEDYIQKFNMINFYAIPKPIQKMMVYKESDNKEQVISFLISFFLNNMGYSLNKVLQIMSAWEKYNVPTYEEVYMLDIINKVYDKPIKYTAELYKQFGFIDFSNHSDKGCVKLPVGLINKFAIIHDCSLRIYIAILMFCKLNNVIRCTKKDIEKVAMVSERTIERRIIQLLDEELVGKQEEKGIIYYSIKDNIIIKDGFTRVSIKQLQKLIDHKDEVSDGCIKVYIWLQHHIMHEIPDFESHQYQIKIGAMTGKKGNTISNITSILNEKGFIIKKTYREVRFNPNTGKREKILRCKYRII
ncbi:hypothetical protein NNC19_15660 [Clostridium sp. SHJSY1]|uniref:hypothetical protein n=1 Tax=Clostridium sp. SHJSY1 TaxID=2942483 RepID=UPI002874F486|nr:hypothetical protein [Clostridium sp. SHJSY1]MDS0527128.1 hypothetical protein [Clostridium sp. SHJSY1]